jgi:hypothetical protein
MTNGNISMGGERKIRMKYLKYLHYLLRHKYYVGIECLKKGLFLRAFTHDISKFSPDEFLPYMNYFYGNGHDIKRGRDKTGYYKPTDTGDKAFDFAWLLHQKRNKHHWQWWVLPEDGGGIKVLEMPLKYELEMICDWVGAGKAQGHFSPKDNPMLETRKWYEANKGKMQLGKITRRWVEYQLNL